MNKKVLYVLVGVAGLLFLVPGISTAADTIKAVLITNDSAHPVPTQAQGTTQVAGSVDVRTGPEARTPYQETDFFNPSAETCTQFVCTASFPAVPAGKRLVVTYASAHYGLTSGGTVPSVRLTDGNSPPNGDSILLPAPVNIGFDTWLAAGPVTFYVEAGQSPTLELTGQFVYPVSNTADVAISGYLVPTS